MTRKLSRRQAIREFSKQQPKPVTREIRRRIREKEDRERRIVRALEAYARMGTFAAAGIIH